MGAAKTAHGAAEVHKGSSDGERTEVWWLAGTALPARVFGETGDRRFTLALKALHAAPPSDWPRIEQAKLAEYLVIDAADFGDMHHEPFV
jgi:hypothetical protein